MDTGNGSQIQTINPIGVVNAPTLVTTSQCNGSSFVSCIAPSASSCSQLAGVVCQTPCSEREPQLVGGRTPSEGIVEVCYDKIYRPICGYNWTESSAKVVCAQLGYSRLGKP